MIETIATTKLIISCAAGLTILSIPRAVPSLATRAAVMRFFAFWCLVAVFEHVVLGPFSFVAPETDVQNLAYLKGASMLGGGSFFNHQFAGGVDAALFVHALQSISLDRAISAIVPPWGVAVAHKLVIVSLGFYGGYRLARELGYADRTTAAVVAAIFPFTHEYLQQYSIEFGTGFAVIPLAVYVAVCRPRHRHFLVWVIGCGIAVGLSQATKVLPATIVAILAAGLLRRPTHPGRTMAAAGVFILFAALNWAEQIYGLFLLAPHTARGLGAETDVADFIGAAVGTANLFRGIALPSSVILLSLGLLAARDRVSLRRACWALFVFVALYLIAVLFPWQRIGLAIINRVEHGYMRLALATLFIPIAAAAFRTRERWNFMPAMRRTGAQLLFAVAVAAAVSAKIDSATLLVAFGGVRSHFGFEDLTRQTWRKDQFARTVTFAETPHPDVTSAYYGIPSFDGSPYINPRRWNSYWHSINRQAVNNVRSATRLLLDWSYFDQRSYRLGDQANLRLLEIAGVRYIVSGLALTARGLRQVQAPDASPGVKTRWNHFGDITDYVRFRLSRIFDPGRHHIYELSDPLPLVFTVVRVLAVDDGLSESDFHKAVADHATSRTAVARRRDAARLRPATASLEITRLTKLPNGYALDVVAPAGGVVLVNNIYLPFWRARADGAETRIVPVNAIQMAVNIPANTARVQILYERPGLWRR